MTDHKHEWCISWRNKTVYCKYTSTCGAVMVFEEVDRRLNACEELTAEDVREEANFRERACDILHLHGCDCLAKIAKLRAYAERRDGEAGIEKG